MPSVRLEPLLRDADLEILHSERCTSGVTGAQILYLRLPDEGVVLKTKWKASKHGGTGLNNEPRKEVASFLVQKWFLSPDEYVVPPTVCRAFPLEEYARAVQQAKPTFDGTSSVFGTLCFWLDDTEQMGSFDVARFTTDPAYRDTMANLNLLTYLIDHRDTRPANFLSSKDPARPRAFSIDNGLSFSGLMNPRVLFVHEWRHIIVPMLPRAKIDLLRAVTRPALDELRVVAQMALRDDGELRSVGRSLPLIEDGEGVVRAEGVLQLGLEGTEIDGIEDRLAKLLAEVDAGHIELY